jgi:hypothetical protein
MREGNRIQSEDTKAFVEELDLLFMFPEGLFASEKIF